MLNYVLSPKHLRLLSSLKYSIRSGGLIYWSIYYTRKGRIFYHFHKMFRELWNKIIELGNLKFQKGLRILSHEDHSNSTLPVKESDWDGIQ